MSFAAVAVVGAAAVGGAMSSDASRKAAHTQADAANNATAAEQNMFNTQVQLQEPWRQTGQQGLNVLAKYLGINSGIAAPGALTGASLVDTSSGVPSYNKQLYNSNEAYRQAWDSVAARHLQQQGNGYTYQADPGWIDREVRTLLAPAYQAEATQAAQNPPAQDSTFGSLLRPFSLDDFQKDPGYDFRLNEGRKTLEGSAAARGGLFSGGAGKALERYGQDYGSNEYGKAFDRYNVTQTNQFNRLASLSGIGQTAANQTGAAAQNFGNQAGSNIIGAGNANAAGQVGQANAFNNALGQGYNMYQSNELMRRLQAPSSGYGGFQGGFSQTSLGGSGFGNGLAYGNQDYGQYF